MKIVDKTKKTLFIIPHLELGNNLIINGMIRFLLNKYNIILVCKENYKEQIEIMYMDILGTNTLYLYYVKGGTIENIYLYNELPIDNNTKKLFNDNNIKLSIFNGYKSTYSEIDYIPKLNYPKFFYDDMNLDWNIQYKYFKIIRKHEEEEELYLKLTNIIGKKYIVVIDDEKRNFIIDKKYILKDIPIFKIGFNSKNKNIELDKVRNKNIFNYIKILENAVEIHSIHSCLLLLIDMLNIPGYIFSYNIRIGEIYEPIYKNRSIKSIK